MVVTLYLDAGFRPVDLEFPTTLRTLVCLGALGERRASPTVGTDAVRSPRCGGAFRLSFAPSTTLQRCGGRCWISSHARSTPKRRWVTSVNALRSLSSRTRDHPPLR